MVVEYNGTDYHGFQFQNDTPTIQAELEGAIHKLTNERVRVKGAGRTDAGVHAIGQVVAFDTETNLSTEKLTNGLNHYLPEDIAVRQVHKASDDFDPRRDAHSRRYRYTILNKQVRAPLSRRTSLLVEETLDVEAMAKSARLLEGIHDFAGFGGPLENEEASTVREIYSATAWKDTQGEKVYFEVEGSAFLPHQVRRMTGALIDVGKGRMTEQNIRQILDRVVGGPVANTVPPQGLCLMEVAYRGFPPRDGEQYDDATKTIHSEGVRSRTPVARP
ncbi:MAG: tRNA pseudouridine(38-40) synthase TruA [Chloroflexi bacterium]|nr:tRNA pseudouridine(38-40) synthase TruA [Chloroflexota bacterium]